MAEAGTSALMLELSSRSVSDKASTVGAVAAMLQNPRERALVENVRAMLAEADKATAATSRKRGQWSGKGAAAPVAPEAPSATEAPEAPAPRKRQSARGL